MKQHNGTMLCRQICDQSTLFPHSVNIIGEINIRSQLIACIIISNFFCLNGIIFIMTKISNLFETDYYKIDEQGILPYK